MKMNCLMQITAITLMIGISAPVKSQSDTTEVDLTELNLEQLHNVKIVTVSKTAQEAGQAPASVYVVTDEQIRIRGYRSLLDVLVDAPDFKIDDKVYSLSRNIITARGIEGQEKFIIMLDGMRISSPTNETMPIMENYPVNLAKQIEIVYGPASALYGADALSGVINIISKKTEYSSSKVEAIASAGDHGLYNGNLFLSRKITKDVVFTASGQYFYDRGLNFSKLYKKDSLWDFSSHTTGTFNTIYGPMTPQRAITSEYSNALKAYNTFAKLTAGDFELSFFKFYSQNSTALENNPSNAVYNKDVFYGRGISNITARHSKSIGKLTFVSTITAMQYKTNPNSNYRNLYSGMEPAYKYAYSSLVQGEEQVEWSPGKTSHIVGGAVYQSFFSLPESTDLQNPVSSSRSIEGILLNSQSYYRPEGLEAKFYALKYYNAGVYLQLQQKIGSRVLLTTGARYDHNSRFGSTLNPRVGMVINATRSTTVKAMAGTAYLAPPPSSVYSYWGTFSTSDSGKTYRANFMHLPNPGLKPLISRNAELSVRQYAGKNFSVTLTGYYTRISNLINFASDAGNTNIYGGKFLGWSVDYIEVFKNEGFEQAFGGSLMLAYNRNFTGGWLRAYSNLSLIDGKESEPGTDGESAALDNISKWMMKCGFDLSMGKFSISPRIILMGRQRLAGLVTEGSEERQTIPGYSLLNVSAGYKVGRATVFVNINNALNQKYKAVGVNMNLQNQNTELFHGYAQDPIRVNGGIRVSL